MKATTEKAFEAYIQESMAERGWVTGSNMLWDKNRALFEKNRLHVTLHILCHLADSSTVDMALSLNGIPLCTLELKNPATGQTWKHAIKQYTV